MRRSFVSKIAFASAMVHRSYAYNTEDMTMTRKFSDVGLEKARKQSISKA